MMRLTGSASLMTRGSILAALLLFGLTAGSSRATIIIAAGNTPQANDENVLLDRNMTGTSVLGVTNQTRRSVRFSSSTQTLAEFGSGQARIEATAGGSQVPLNNISINVPNGTFESLIFNAFVGGQVGGSGSLTISVADNVSPSPTTLTSTIANGSNFFTITSDAVQSILSVNLSFSPASSGFTDLRQVRIGGAAVAPVPEPSTMAAALSGIACLSLAGFRKLRRRSAEAKA